MSVAIIGVAQSRYRPYPELNPSELVYPVVQAALADAGVGMDEIESVVTCSQDIYDGRTISSMGVNESVGGYLRSESKIAGDGLLALLYGVARIRSGQYPLTLVVAHCLESMGDARVIESASFDPYVQRPMGPDLTVSAALQAARLYASGAATAHGSAEVAATASRRAAANPLVAREREFIAADVEASPTVCGPLRELETKPLSDGACALVLADTERSASGPHPPVWIRGLQTIAAGFWTDRDLLDTSALRRAAARAGEESGLRPTETAIVESSARWAYELLMNLPVLGVDPADERVNPSGGQLGGVPIFVTGLATAAEAASRLRAGAGRHALIHSPGGIAGQQHTVGYLSLERGRG